LRIPRYWTKGEFYGVDSHGNPLRFEAWGWSDISLDDAQQKGAERARHAFLASSRDQRRHRVDDYDAYLKIPLREEVIERIGLDDDEIAVVTRNRYGSLVLNTSRVLFADVDLPPGRHRGLRWYFSAKKREEELMQRHRQVVDRIMTWSAANPQYSFRLYQTRAGYRLLFTSQLFDPLSDEVEIIFEGLGSDPLYRTLTRKQECFRARLTPKPWRIKMGHYRYYPELEAPKNRDHQIWLMRYEDASKGYQVCTYMGPIGNSTIASAEVTRIIQQHDRWTICGEELPLA
jgi:hypothetical protein